MIEVTTEIIENVVSREQESVVERGLAEDYSFSF